MKHQDEKVDGGKSGDTWMLRQYAAATGTFAVPAWLNDLSIEVVTIFVTFVFVGCVASVLFNRLAGIRGLPYRYSKWADLLQAAAFGALGGVAGVFGHEYTDYIGIGSAALAGLIVSLTDAAWRQRGSERQLYRETLLFPG